MTQLFPPDYAAESDLQAPATRPLVILGFGGLGREILVLLGQLNAVGANWDVRGFYDDRTPAGPTVAGLLYLGTSADLNATPELLAVAVAVGDSAARAALVARLTSPRLSFPPLVHPGVELRPTQRITLGEGCLIQPGCVLTCDIQLGRFVLLSAGCTVGHDAVLDDFCSLMPQVSVGGATHLHAAAYLGAHATVLQGLRIGVGATLGAGAVALRDVPPHVTAVGVPARVIGNARNLSKEGSG